MTVGLRTSWLQYPVETITSPRCMKYGIPYRTPKYTSQTGFLSRNYLYLLFLLRLIYLYAINYSIFYNKRHR